MKFSINNFFGKCDQIREELWIWSQLLRKSLMENFIFCAVRRPEEDFFESLINEHSIYVSYPKEYSFKVRKNAEQKRLACRSV